MKFFTKKRIIWGIVIIIIVGLIGARVFGSKNNSQNVTIDTVKRQDIKATVLATGQVVSKTDLDLGFKGGGVVDQVYVQEGQPVKQGQMLAQLDQRDAQATLTQARGALAAAQANYDKVIAGASSQDIEVAQKAVDAAQVALANATSTYVATQSQQDTAVANAYHTLLNSGVAAVPSSSNIDAVTATITGTYVGTDQGQYQIKIYNTGSGAHFTYSGLENGDGIVSTVPTPLGNRGLFIEFSTISITPSDAWTITLPNTLASTYVTNYNAYQTAVQTQNVAESNAQAAVNSSQVALAQAQAALDLKKAQARPADVQAAQAQILTAQGQVQAAQTTYDNTILRAPSDGTVTSVDIKTGEQATALKEVMVLQDVSNLHIEADVSEANIASLKPDQSVDVTFDALGPDRHFNATIQTVNPASTVVSGVVNYKVTAKIDNLPEIKPGMTANMTILTDQKSNVLVVPQRAVIPQDGKQYVRLVDDVQKKTYHQVEVQTGLSADGGLVEIIGGLNVGQNIVTYIKQ